MSFMHEQKKVAINGFFFFHLKKDYPPPTITVMIDTVENFQHN